MHFDSAYESSEDPNLFPSPSTLAVRTSLPTQPNCRPPWPSRGFAQRSSNAVREFDSAGASSQTRHSRISQNRTCLMAERAPGRVRRRVLGHSEDNKTRVVVLG